MTEAADLVVTDAEVHTLAGGGPAQVDPPDETAEAVAVRDGEIVAVGDAYEVDFLVGVETEVVDLDGRVLLPGFVDAHTHLESTGQYVVHADLSAADSVDNAVSLLESEGREDREWVQGFGWDESDWPAGRYLRREDLDRVSEERPVAAFRVDMHTATLNGVALDRLDGELPEDDVEHEDGEPTGVVVEDAVEAVREAIGRGYGETRELVTAARDRAQRLGVTCVHEKVRDSHAPRVYRDLAADGELGLRVRIDYWSDHLDAVEEVGLPTNAGSGMVQVGGVKSFTDGSIGGRTAKLFEPYADAGGDGDDGGDGGDGGGGDGDGDNGVDDARGQWVVDPDDYRALVQRVDDGGRQMVTHAIGDEAVALVVEAYEATDDPGAARHRIEHVELGGDDLLARMADAGMVASCQPNFLQWADEGGLYDQRLGEQRRRNANRFRDLLDAGVPLAFGSDSMPLGPLEGVHHAVNAPADAQRLTVTEALRAYTYGAAYAGFDEDRLGTVEVGKRADLVALERSPWDHSDDIRAIDVVTTVVDGDVVYDGR